MYVMYVMYDVCMYVYHPHVNVKTKLLKNKKK